MPPIVHIHSRITPWDDAAFVRAYERAVAEVEGSTEPGEGPAAASRVEALLHEAGYPDARIDVLRTASEALEHTSHWDVRRDG